MSTDTNIRQLILASRSPRRRELLESAVGADRISVQPPSNPDEPGFEGLKSVEAIQAQVAHIASLKYSAVRREQLNSPVPPSATPKPTIIVAADTTIVAIDNEGQPVVLGQPPEDESFAQTVTDWFNDLLIGRSHLAISAVCVGDMLENSLTQVVTTTVTFRPDTGNLVKWYISTDEPRGKAGGYAIQGAGSVFVESIEGSLSNVVGLPLNETLHLLGEFGIHV